MTSEATRFADEEQFGKAIDRYETALQLIRSYPFNLNLDQLEREISTGLTRLKDRKKVQEEKERFEFREMLEEEAKKERSMDLEVLQNQIRQLRRKASSAESNRDYERAATLYKRILTVNPRDEDAKIRLKAVSDRRHIQRMDDLRKQASENYELAIVGIEESSVIYQQIFRYPDIDEWRRLSPKVPSIEEEIAATETPVEKELRSKLVAKHSISFEEETPFNDVLQTLQEISGLNFVLTREGAEAESETIQLPQMTNLPLENILNIVLKSVGSKAGSEFGYALKEGAIVVGPTESLQIREYLKFYDISDLISSRPDFPAPNIALDELAGKQSGGDALVDLGGDEGESDHFAGTRQVARAHSSGAWRRRR